jgi:hypothetical protein
LVFVTFLGETLAGEAALTGDFLVAAVLAMWMFVYLSA